MFDLDTFVQDCHDALEEHAPVSAVREVVERAVADPGIGAVLTPDRTAYGVLHRSERLTVLHIGLPPTLGSSVHEHLMWAVVGIHSGQEDNQFFRRGPTGAPEPSGGRAIRDGEVLAMGDDTVHSIRNPLRRYVSALHVYGGDLLGAPRREWDATGASRPFDAEGPVRAAALAQREEARLGRPLEPEEVQALLRTS